MPSVSSAVLDASALLAFLNDEPGAERIGDLLPGAIISAVNFSEIVAKLAERGVPTLLTGFDLPDGNVHSPNERFLLEHFPLGVGAARELFLAYAAL